MGRSFVRLLRIIAICSLVSYASAVAAFDFDDVAKRAQQLAARPYQPSSVRLPKELASLGYDRYRDIRYRTDRSVWREQKLPFELQFFPMGTFYDQPVRMHEIVNDVVRDIRFDPALFDIGKNTIDPGIWRGLDFGGFRAHYPINTQKYRDEVIAFLGASYFRAVGKGQRYGASARGLALDTALASGEEFPRYTDFWIERPGANARELVIYALLDSRRVAGAYRFILRPGAETLIDVKARLFLRENVTKFGIAPLTSMFHFGENQRPHHDDYRPEVHDSDGLLIHSGTGEWLWRPLVNPRRLLVTSFALVNPIGFGLMQRDREFEHYQDLEARYELRPSIWVEPRGNWGAGRVELVLIPSPDETNDNVVAYWVPDTPPAVREPFDVEYRLHFQRDNETHGPQSWVSASRRGHGYSRGNDPTIGFVIDFDGPALRKLSPEAVIEAIVTAVSNAEIVENIVARNEVTGGARVRLRVRRLDDARPVDLRAFLRTDGNTVSTTWSYIIPPN
ncbi:MAG TPA: glucan biosynthesis protein G [Casimicrobiaceae bacterium]|nr:glucan biosynthesis protein G [Casimicrobiaceae bacterium]